MPQKSILLSVFASDLEKTAMVLLFPGWKDKDYLSAE